MKEETHIAALKESFELIRECVKVGIEKRQRTLGFHCSAGAIDLLELLLHQMHKLDVGTTLHHDMFASAQRAKKNLPDFQSKDKIVELINKIEVKRNIFVYGKPQTRESIEEFLETYNKLKEIMEDMGVHYE